MTTKASGLSSRRVRGPRHRHQIAQGMAEHGSAFAHFAASTAPPIPTTWPNSTTSTSATGTRSRPTPKISSMTSASITSSKRSCPTTSSPTSALTWRVSPETSNLAATWPSQKETGGVYMFDQAR